MAKTQHPWQVGPTELIQFALERMHLGGDVDRRLAFLILDVGVETLFKTFLTLPEGVFKHQINREERIKAAKGNFPDLLRAVQNSAPQKSTNIYFFHIDYYHNLRNMLYHQGNHVTTVTMSQLEGYAQLAVKLLREYLDVDLSAKLKPPKPIKQDGSEPVADSVEVEVSFGRFRIERLKSKSIRVFSLSTNSFESLVKPFLRAIIDELSLPVELTSKTGLEKNTRILGRDVIIALKSTKNHVGAKKKRKKTKPKKEYTYDVAAYGIQKRYLIKENVMFNVIKILCKYGIAPRKIAELIPWRTVFFELEGELSAADFIEHANSTQKINRGKFDQSRWFCDDGQLIIHNGKTYAFTNHWGTRWTTALRILQKAFPEANIEFSKNQ